MVPKWMVGLGLEVIVVAGLVRARHFDALRYYVQFGGALAFMGAVYWMGWDGHEATRKAVASPTWLSWLCARPGQRLVARLAVIQVGALGFLMGNLIGLFVAPRAMVACGFIGAVLSVLLFGGTWAVWGLLTRL